MQEMQETGNAKGARDRECEKCKRQGMRRFGETEEKIRWREATLERLQKIWNLMIEDNYMQACTVLELNKTLYSKYKLSGAAV